MRRGKKFINDPNEIVDQVTEGLVAASMGRTRRVGEAAVIVRNALPQDKVGLLVGGGSGHEPLFSGFVGENMADGAVAGNIFAAPTPDQILIATKAVDCGKGVLYLYGNYAGDIMNFDIASELAAEEGILTKTVRIWDDVASAPLEQIDERRGIAGDLLVIKAAGAAAANLNTLEEVYELTCRARDNTRSIGVAAAAGTFPETGLPTFEDLPPDEIEVGMGVHGEPGVSRIKMPSADELANMMMESILTDLPFKGGDRVVMLINNLGSTTMTELLIVNRRANQILDEQSIQLHDTLMGAYCTSQEMAGFSISLMRLDQQLQEYYDLPAYSVGFVKGAL
jgi:dihydroxyacetone kinase-like protein